MGRRPRASPTKGRRVNESQAEAVGPGRSPFWEFAFNRGTACKTWATFWKSESPKPNWLLWQEFPKETWGQVRVTSSGDRSRRHSSCYLRGEVTLCGLV